MLASRFHLPGYLIPEVKEKGRFYRFFLFSLIVLKDKKQKFSRFSIILSSKFDKKAVVRNQVKRKVLNSVRLLLPKIKSGYSIVFLPKKVLRRKSLDQIQEAIEQAFVKTGIIQ